MSGKKAAITLIGIILLASLLVVIAIKLFFVTYEPKQTENQAEAAVLLAPNFEHQYKS